MGRVNFFRVRFKTSSRVTELSEHEADGGKFQEREGVAVEVFPILGETAATVEPGDCALDDPASGQHDESVDLIGAFDDFDFELRQDLRQGFLEHRSLIAAVGEQLLQERIHPEQGRKQQEAAVTVLDIGGMNDRMQQQTQRIYEKVALLALDLLARIIARRIDPGPPFSALLTLWLSMMAAVGLASRSPCSRHSKYSA